MERQRFEESFREAFNGAEVAPPDSVWTNVELDLEKATGGKMKRRLLFFQLLAAASMVFAMGVGSVYYLNNNHAVDNEPLTKQTPQGTSANEAGIAIQNQSQPESKTSDKKDVTEENLKTYQSKSTQDATKNTLTQPLSPVLGETDNSSTVLANEYKIIGDKRLPSLVKIEKPTIKLIAPEPTADPGMVLLAKLKDEEKKYQEEDKKDITEKIWTSVGVGAGSYNPNASSSSSSTPTSFGGSSSNPTSGSSYSLGVSVAGKIGQRFVIQGGVSYLTNNAEYTSSAASGSSGLRASLNEFAATSNDQIVATNPYQVNSNLQYMSIPLQAGYIIIDRAFAVQLNGGISTDLFLQSTLTPDDQSIDKVTQGAGADSPYRTVNFSGLVGTEVSYKVGDHYRIALNPGLRYALSPIYKSEVSAQTSPVTFDVGLRFRYIFK